MNFYWRRVESQEKLQRRGNSVHNITLVGFRGQKLVGPILSKRVGSKFHTSQKRSTCKRPRQLHDVTRKSELKAGNTSVKRLRACENINNLRAVALKALSRVFFYGATGWWRSKAGAIYHISRRRDCNSVCKRALRL
jgi:hypothetical protein